MYAIIKTGGKQYVVEEGKVISIEKLDVEEGAEVTFDEVLLVSGDDVKIGAPNVAGAKVPARFLNRVRNARSVSSSTRLSPTTAAARVIVSLSLN